MLKQQGRVDVDADWNEQQAITANRVETEAADVIGASGAPLHAAGFHVVTTSGDLTAEEQKLPGNQSSPGLTPGDFLIGAGRFYVGGILCENEQITTYTSQPDLPFAPDLRSLFSASKTALGIVYLDVWQRHLTALDDPLIREKALNGPDTATRLKTVWQVKVLPVSPRIIAALSDNNALGTRMEAFLPFRGIETGLTPVNFCGRNFSEWDSLVAAGTGMLNARTQPPDPTESACLLPPTAGYNRLENQLYRVEVQSVTAAGVPTFFKWSRDNGVVVTAIKLLGGNRVVVEDVGPDDVLGFAAGQWVEISTDETELAGQSGQLLQIAQVDPVTRTVTTKQVPSAVNLAAHPKLRRWDQAGSAATASGVPVTFDWQALEGGIEVIFSKGTCKAGDYWTIPARTATGDIEWPVVNGKPVAQPPGGTKHHYARLGVISMDGTTVLVREDCRKIFIPLTEIVLPTVNALHVSKISWQNDEPMVFAERLLVDGLQIALDAAPDPASFAKRLDSSSSASVVVSMELPGLGDGAAEQNALRSPVQVEGQVDLPSSTTIRWTPTRTALFSIFNHLQTAVKMGGPGLIVYVRLRGSFIWSTLNGRHLYLDGRALGVPGVSSVVSRPTRTDLQFPSGSGAPASDFESWFYLVAPPPVLTGLTLDPSTTTFDKPASVGTVTLSGIAPPDGIVVTLASGDPASAQVPVNVMVPGGTATATFPITTVSSIFQNKTVTISARLDLVTQTAPLTVDMHIYLR